MNRALQRKDRTSRYGYGGGGSRFFEEKVARGVWQQLDGLNEAQSFWSGI